MSTCSSSHPAETSPLDGEGGVGSNDLLLLVAAIDEIDRELVGQHVGNARAKLAALQSILLEHARRLRAEESYRQRAKPLQSASR